MKKEDSLLLCRVCEGKPHIVHVFCTGRYYECDCGRIAYIFPIPQTEGLAKEVWNKMNKTKEGV